MSTNDSFIKQWSKTPASNGTSPNIVPYGWPEGQPPSSVNNVARQQMTDHRYQWEDAEWFCRGEGNAISLPVISPPTLSKASATSFKISTDVTATYHEDRRIKIFDTTTKYATIESSSYSAPDTTVNLLFDNNDSIGSSLSAVALSILSATNTSIPRGNALNKNLIIGGNFDTNPWQRNITFTTISSTQYTADRFVWTVAGAGVVTVQRSTDAPTVAQSGIFTEICLDVSTTTADNSLAATDNYAVTYKVEGYDFAQIAQQPFTISFWVKATITGTYCISFTNNGGDQYYVKEYTINASNTWEYKTVTVPASPSAGTWNYTTQTGLKIDWTLAAGSNFQGTANAWTGSSAKTCTSNQVNAMNSNANHFKLQLVQLEPGSDASAFEIEPISKTISKCQRYFEKSYDQGVYDLTTNPTGVLGMRVTGSTGNTYQMSVVYQTEKVRSGHTVNIYAQSTGHGATPPSGLVSQDDGSDITSTTNFVGMNGFNLTWTNGAGRTGGFFQFTADSEL